MGFLGKPDRKARWFSLCSGIPYFCIGVGLKFYVLGISGSRIRAGAPNLFQI